jgi:hypothetical protein
MGDGKLLDRTDAITRGAVLVERQVSCADI